MMRNPRSSVLIVDDYPNWLDFLKELLEGEFEVTTAKDYEMAVHILRTQPHPFDAMVVDVRLEDSDSKNEAGLQLAKDVLTISPFTKAIVVTGYTSIRLAKEALRELNVFDFLEKNPRDEGFSPLHFRQVVREAVDAARKARSLFAFEQSIKGLTIDFFQRAQFDIKPIATSLFQVKRQEPEWQRTGQILVSCFEEGEIVTAKKVNQLVDEITKNNQRQKYYGFIIFDTHLPQGMVQELWELRQKPNPIFIIPIHASEIKQTLHEQNTISNPAYKKILNLKSLWSNLVDPYASLNPLNDPQWYFGNHQKQVVQTIVSEIITGRNLAVFGARRSGKTMLLNQLILNLQTERHGFIVAKITCKPFSAKYTSVSILEEIMQEWLSELGTLYPDFKKSQEIAPNPPYSLETISSFTSEFRSLVKTVQKELGDFQRFVLVLDEVDHIFPVGEKIPEVYEQYVYLAQILKSIMELPDQAGVFSLVIAMEYPLINLVNKFSQGDLQNPLYGRFEIRPIDFLSKEDWDEMVQTVGATVGLTYDTDSLNTLYITCAGHPEITRKLGSCLVDLRDKGEIGNFITIKEIKVAINYFLEHPFNSYTYYLEATFWNNPLSVDLETEKLLITELARNDGITKEVLFSFIISQYQNSDIQPVLNANAIVLLDKIEENLRRLIDLRIVREDKQSNSYTIYVPIYRDWICQEKI